MTAVVSVPAYLTGRVGGALSRGVLTIPTREIPGRTYFIVPLLALSGVGVFNQPDIDVEYFDTRDEAFAWGDADIERRSR